MNHKKRQLLMTVAALFVITQVLLPVEARDLYFSEQISQKIYRVDPDGSNLEVLVSGVGTVMSIAIHPDGSHLYWTQLGGDDSSSFGERGIRRISLDDREVTTLIPSAFSGSSAALAIDESGGRIYWTDSLDNNIRSANLDGSDQRTVLDGLPNPSGIAIDSGSGKMYWSETTGGQRVRRSNLDGTVLEDLVTDTTQPIGVALDIENGKLYFASSIDETIERANLDGSEREVLISSEELRFPANIALDMTNKWIFWTEAGFTSGLLRRASLDVDSNIEDLFLGDNPVAIAYFDSGEIAVNIDIKPRSVRNTINLRSRHETVIVAVLSDGEFDARQVNADTVRFGPGKTGPGKSRLRDVDRDGDTDVLFKFIVRSARIKCSDRRAELTGEMYSGQSIVGSDVVRPIGCRSNDDRFPDS